MVYSVLQWKVGEKQILQQMISRYSNVIIPLHYSLDVVQLSAAKLLLTTGPMTT